MDIVKKITKIEENDKKSLIAYLRGQIDLAFKEQSSQEAIDTFASSPDGNQSQINSFKGGNYQFAVIEINLEYAKLIHNHRRDLKLAGALPDIEHKPYENSDQTKTMLLRRRKRK